MTDDSKSQQNEEERVDVDRDDISDSTEEEVVTGDTIVDDEPEELDEEATDDPEYEPLEPDVPS